MIGPAEVLADCEANGIRLLPDGDGGLTIDAQKAALTPALLDRLRAHKAGLLALLPPIPNSVPAPTVAIQNPAVNPAKPVSCKNLHHDPRCWQDETAGNRIRTTCKLCGRFIGYRPADLSRSRH